MSFVREASPFQPVASAGQAGTCFPDDLHVMKNPDQDQFVVIKPSASGAGIFLNLRDRIENVAEAQRIVPHIGTASRRTCCRTCSRSPRDETTSTFWSSSASRCRCNRPKSSRLRPWSRSTRKSMSLWGRFRRVQPIETHARSARRYARPGSGSERA